MYIVLEIQEPTEGGTPATITHIAPTLNDAMSKYHDILHYAAISELFRHSAVVMTTDGKYVARESYKHAAEVNNETA